MKKIFFITIFAALQKSFYENPLFFLAYKSPLFFSAFVLFFLSCSTQPLKPAETIDPTVVPEIPTVSDEWLVVPLEDLPFALQMPAGWMFTEIPPEYIVNLDDGLKASLHFDKAPKEKSTWVEWVPDGSSILSTVDDDLTVFCHWPSADRRQCTLDSPTFDALYVFSITEKTLSESEKIQLEGILKSLTSD